MHTKKIGQTPYIQIVTLFSFIIVLAMAVLVPVACADKIAIANINDSYLYQEVTVSGNIVSITTSSVEEGKNFMTIDDGSGSISVKYSSELFANPQFGQRITVTGIYARKGMIYADSFGLYVDPGYKSLTIAELKKFPEYYYGDSVRVTGNITRITLTHEQTELVIKDKTGEIKVILSGVVREDFRLDEKVVVEGKCYRDTIAAFTVYSLQPKLEQVDEISPDQSSTPTQESPVSQPAPTPIFNEEDAPLLAAIPGFQGVPVIVALLALAYFLRVRT